MQAYKLIDNGFSIDLDLSLFARQAVMKALYKFHTQYLISYEADGEGHLRIYFESSQQITDIDAVVASVLRELNCQMIRYDTMRATNNLRELLVARALYATCVENDRRIDSPSSVYTTESWEEDRKNIFSSWSIDL